MAKKNPYEYQGVGRRKSAVARVYLAPGDGAVEVNHRDLKDFFPRALAQKAVLRPFEVTNNTEKFRTKVTVRGGGPQGQAEAVRLGIARALSLISEESRASLKKEGLLTRDPRIVERKKYGQRGARRRFQYSKR